LGVLLDVYHQLVFLSCKISGSDFASALLVEFDFFEEFEFPDQQMRGEKVFKGVFVET
jgi:hypothetical protein